MLSKKRMLGEGGSGIRKKPSFANNVAFLSSRENALSAPYLRHIGLSAPYIAASPPELLPGLLLPSISSPKPPSARKAPTRTNLFKAQRTLSLAPDCNSCGTPNGTIIVFHYGMTPPQCYLCYAIPDSTGKERLIPFEQIRYQVDPASQFTYAANAAASIALEITSFAAANPLNGQATAAHVMDLDDIDVYSTGSFELRSTTPKDSVNSITLTNGLIGVMGPESWPETLLHPYHSGAKTYPGWSYSVNLNNFDSKGTATVNLSDMTEHRWFNDTTFDVNCTVSTNEGLKKGGWIYVWMLVDRGMCPPSTNCSPGALARMANATDEWVLVAYSAIATSTSGGGITECKKPDGTVEDCDKKDIIKAQREARKKILEKIKCAKDPQEECEVDEIITCDKQAKGITPTCDFSRRPNKNQKDPMETPYSIYQASGTYTTCPTEQPHSFMIEFRTEDPATTTVPQCATLNIRTRCANPEAQFGPAFVARLQGLTKDIIIQLNIRSAVSGVQSGAARSVAPPTGPSLLPLGEEDAVMTQAYFDSDSTPIARVMQARTYAAAGTEASSATRERAVRMMEAAPLGDTIRSIAGTVSNIGRGLGGPFSTIGDIVGTVGNIAGGIGDAIGSIFSAPRVIHAAPIGASPLAPGFQKYISDDTYRILRGSEVIQYEKDPDRPNQATVLAAVKANRSWSNNLTSFMKLGNTNKLPSMQAFPWVLADEDAGGVSNVFLTTTPMNITERPLQPRYYSFRNIEGEVICYIDERLVIQNEAKYVDEVPPMFLWAGMMGVYVTTDAPFAVYGDSYSLAVLAALVQPSLQSAVSGGIEYDAGGYPIPSPVGKIIEKLEVCMEEGFKLVAPIEQPLQWLRSTSEGSKVIVVDDMIAGQLQETPTACMVDSVSELLMIQAFLSATSSSAIGTEEAAEKARLDKISRDATERQESLKRERGIPAKPTEQDIERAKNQNFIVELPGFPAETEAKLLDFNWWKDFTELFQSPADKGMGVTPDRLKGYINSANISRLIGLAKGVLSRRASRLKKAGGARKAKQPKKTPSRVPAYKKGGTSQVASLIDRLRQRNAEPEEEEEMEAD